MFNLEYLIIFSHGAKKNNLHLWTLVHIVINVTVLELCKSVKNIVSSMHLKPEKKDHANFILFLFWKIRMLTIQNLNPKRGIYRSVAKIKEIQMNATCNIKFHDKYKAITTAPKNIQISRVKNNLENMSHVYKLP